GWIMQFEDDAGVVIEPAAECGCETDAAHVDAPRRQNADPALEQIERRIELELCLLCKSAQPCGGSLWIAGDGKESLDEGAHVLRQGGPRGKGRLIEEAICDLADRTPADRRNAG